MVVGKVSEFIGSLYYLCVTLLRFKNIMKLKNYLLLFALLLVVGVRAQVPSGIEFSSRGRYQCHYFPGASRSGCVVCFAAWTVEPFPDRDAGADTFSYVGPDAIYDWRVPETEYGVSCLDQSLPGEDFAEKSVGAGTYLSPASGMVCYLWRSVIFRSGTSWKSGAYL